MIQVARPGSSVGDTVATWTTNPEVVEAPLDGTYRLLFNPFGTGGVTIVNEATYRLFGSIGRGATIGDVLATWPGQEDDVTAVIAHLANRGLIRPEESAQPAQDGTAAGAADQAGGGALTAWLHVTNDCNLRCPYCYVNKSADRMDESTGHAAVRAVISSAAAHGFRAVKLQYAGGEASMNRQIIVSLHDLAKSLAAEHGLELHATLLSNGVALPPALVETLRTENIKVMISLDGVGELHDAVRPTLSGRPSFRHVERTIDQLISQGHPPHLSVTITGRNAAGLADVVRFALERDLTFTFSFYRDNDQAQGISGLAFDNQEMIDSVLKAFGVIEDVLPPWSVLGSVLDRGQLLQPRQRSCGVGQDYVVIDQRGRVAQCHMEIGQILGDVFHDDPLALVRHETAPIRSLPVVQKEGCRDCAWQNWCTGGCPVATHRATGRWDVKSPNCSIYKAIYPAALRLEGLRLLKYHMPEADRAAE